ncbi:MAG: hypothetical protein IPL84_02025 [Chitinophagaceae bacterium]|nr:hypothetical protein [Chitinophagaceae bacterium]
MKPILEQAIEKLNVDKKLILVYAIVYLAWGTGMNYFGIFMQIARFTYWWQIITCYLLYMVPVSLLLRNLPFHAQYAYGLVAMGFLEFGGYAIQSSYVYPDNILEKLFTPQNFALGMALFFALYFPVGNWAVGKIYGAIFKPQQKST